MPTVTGNTLKLSDEEIKHYHGIMVTTKILSPAGQLTDEFKDTMRDLAAKDDQASGPKCLTDALEKHLHGYTAEIKIIIITMVVNVIMTLHPETKDYFISNLHKNDGKVFLMASKLARDGIDTGGCDHDEKIRGIP